jgi:hypothetical protein
VGVLDASACALFADFENKGLQDLLVICAAGPLLFLNEGNGKFKLKADAFKFARPPQGTFTHAALADYDHDGRLDIYFCLCTAIIKDLTSIATRCPTSTLATGRQTSFYIMLAMQAS